MKLIILAIVSLAVIGIVSGADKLNADDERLRETISKTLNLDKSGDMKENIKKLKELPNKVIEIANKLQMEQKAKMEELKIKVKEDIKKIENKVNEMAKARGLPALMEMKNENISKFLEAVKQAAKTNAKQN